MVPLPRFAWEEKAAPGFILPHEMGEGDHAKRGGGGARHDHALGHARHALGARDRARAHPLPLGDAGGRRGACPICAISSTRAGFAAELVAFEAPGTPTVLNLHARFGTGRPNFAFAGHTDVVPPGDVARWRFDPFAAEIADGQLCGRGACDMKGGVAAAVAAALRFIAKAPFAGSISFLITGDEEGPAINGTVKLLDWALARGERFDHCIVGEPTCVSALGDTIKHGRRGSLNGRLAIHGRQGHVAYPQIAENPIRALAPVLAALLDPPLDQGNADFEPSNLEVTSVDVGNRRAERHSGRGPARLQHPLQRSLDARIALGRNCAAGRGGGERAHDARLRADQRGRVSDQARRRSPISSPPRSRT